MRTSPDSDTFLINPFGLQYREVTAGSLVKVNSCGGIINEGTTRLGISRAGYTLHSAIHAARPEIQCVIHVHTVVGAAVSIYAVLDEPWLNMCMHHVSLSCTKVDLFYSANLMDTNSHYLVVSISWQCLPEWLAV